MFSCATWPTLFQGSNGESNILVLSSFIMALANTECVKIHIWYLVDKAKTIFFVHVMRNGRKVMFPSCSDQTADWKPSRMATEIWCFFLQTVKTWEQCLLMSFMFFVVIHFYIFANDIICKKKCEVMVEATALDRWGFAWGRWLMVPQF